MVKLLDADEVLSLQEKASRGGVLAALHRHRLATDERRKLNALAQERETEAHAASGDDWRQPLKMTPRGLAGAGGGRQGLVGSMPEWRGTTVQVAGLWPWAVGAGAPIVGTPLGSHLVTGGPVCFDPLNWFARGNFLSNPSAFVLGLPGYGKSTLTRKIVIGSIAQGVTPLVLGDMKPDYRRLVELHGGQVINLGRGKGKLNPLAVGALGSILPELKGPPALHQQVSQLVRGRQVTMMSALVELVRGARIADFEETLLSTALEVLYSERGHTAENPPLIRDLLELLLEANPHADLVDDAGCDSVDEYVATVKPLRRASNAILRGPFGEGFAGHTTAPVNREAEAVCVDVSDIAQGDAKLKAAVMLTCWSDGFGAMEAAHLLHDAGLGPQRYFLAVLDELWQVLGAGVGMVDRTDEITRLNRSMGTGLLMITHTVKDLESLKDQADATKAVGFIERAGALIVGALPLTEMKRLNEIKPFTAREVAEVTSWSSQASLTGEALRPGEHRPPPPGQGKFLLKLGEEGRPGIPMQVRLTPTEVASGVHDTNTRFSEMNQTTKDLVTDETDGSQE